MGALPTLTDIPSLYSKLLCSILLTPGILKVHLHIVSRCSSLLPYYDPILGRPSPCSALALAQCLALASTLYASPDPQLGPGPKLTSVRSPAPCSAAPMSHAGMV